MGRQGYLTRLAFGRSAFEPPEPTLNAPQRQLEVGNHGIAESPMGEEAVSDLYTVLPQQYDDRGHPINPAARAYGRDMRAAQNDILALVGVVVRNAPEDPSSGRAISLNDDEAAKEEEHVTGNFICMFEPEVILMATWWISSLRKRILVFLPRSSLSFTDVVTFQYQRFGAWSFCLSGLPLQLLRLQLYDRAKDWAELAMLVADRITLATVRRRELRKSYSKYRPWLKQLTKFTLEILSMPLLLHPVMHALHLIPARYQFPLPRSWIPFTSASPIQLLPIPSPYTPSSLLHWCGAIIQSPGVLMWLYHGSHFWVRGLISRPLRYGIMAFSLSDKNTGHYGFLPTLKALLGWRTLRRPDSRPGTIANPLPQLSPNQAPVQPPNNAENILETDHTGVQGRPSTPNPSHRSAPHDPSTPLTIRAESTQNTEPEPTADSPASSVGPAHPEADQEDATIRISSTDATTGTVNLEIALTEAQMREREQRAAELAASQSRPMFTRKSGRSLRLTSLSAAPSFLLLKLMEDWLATVLLLPLEVMVLRRCVSTFLYNAELASMETPSLALLSPVWEVGLHPLLPSYGDLRWNGWRTLMGKVMLV